MGIGNERLRTNDPPESLLVDDIKRKSAALINLCATMPKPKDKNKREEFARALALAMAQYEGAAMWAVKAATIE
jgi:hypothetical protein